MKTTQDIRTDFENICNEIAQLQLSKEQSFELALAILEEYGKYNRGAEAVNSRANGKGSNLPATEGQKNALSKFRVKFAESITKDEASALLDKAIAEAEERKKGRLSAPSFPK